MTGAQQSSPSPFAPSSVQSRWLKAALISVATTPATARIAAGSNMAAIDGPLGKLVGQRPCGVQLDSWDECMLMTIWGPVAVGTVGRTIKKESVSASEWVRERMSGGGDTQGGGRGRGGRKGCVIQE